MWNPSGGGGRGKRQTGGQASAILHLIGGWMGWMVDGVSRSVGLSVCRSVSQIGSWFRVFRRLGTPFRRAGIPLHASSPTQHIQWRSTDADRDRDGYRQRQKRIKISQARRIRQDSRQR